MIKDIEQLIMCLSNQKDLYKELIGLSTKKKQIIINNDVSLLDSIIENEMKLIDRITKEEELRSKTVSSIAKKANIAGEVTLNRIINIANDKYKTVLEDLFKDLEAELKELKRINTINGKLINTQLYYIDSLISVFILGNQNNYGSGGNEEKGKTQAINLFDRMV